MAHKYCTKEEEEEIIRLYKTGEHSYRELADRYNLSKSTIINIVRRYPYNKDKIKYYNKMQDESSSNLMQELVKAKEAAHKAYCEGDMAAYGLYTKQWLVLLDMGTLNGELYDRAKAERMLAEQKAWESFARSDYGEFGYHADTWKLFTEIIGDNAKNPWGEVAKMSNARNKSKSVRFSQIDRKGRNINFTANAGKPKRIKLSDKSWKFIKPLVPEKDTGRPSDHRRILEGVLYALMYCNSFSDVPREYGNRHTLAPHFAEWYKDEVFSGLLQLLYVCPELVPVKQAMLVIQDHKLIYGDVPPRLSDIRKACK